MIVTHRQLVLFAENLKMCNDWNENEDEFAQDLSIFFAALLEDPVVEADDLVGGFKEYNLELFAWFIT